MRDREALARNQLAWAVLAFFFFTMGLGMVAQRVIDESGKGAGGIPILAGFICLTISCHYLKTIRTMESLDAEGGSL